MMPGAGDRAALREIARRAMEERGLDVGFAPEALGELDAMAGPAPVDGERDLRGLPWCSIDNDDSMDLDQLSWAAPLPGGGARILVAVADVDALVSRGSALDRRASRNTASVYTAAEVFPMLPARLSEDLSSLAEGGDRLAIVVEMALSPKGEVLRSELYRAAVRNRAKLAYASVAAWLEGSTPAPAALSAAPGVAESVRLQEELSRAMRTLRFESGALEFESIEARPVFDGDKLSEMRVEAKDRAKAAISEIMIAANGAAARFLAGKGLPCVARVVRAPARWDRIVALAAGRGTSLPAEPDSKALEAFLAAAKKSDPLRFPDLSMSVVKLLGSGEYVALLPGQEGAGHFALASRSYAHTTAPNRRFPDILSQRLIKAALSGKASPYSDAELAELAQRCTKGEDAAKKVERQVEKAASALLLCTRIGDRFDAIVTGAAPKGTWVRVLSPHVEGKLERGQAGLEVGDTLRVELIAVDAERGFIDFARA